MEIRKNIEGLKNLLEEHQPIIVALSGGMDSCFLSYMANMVCGNNMMAITIDSSFSIEKEIEYAKEFSTKYNIKHDIIKAEPLKLDEVVKNDRFRCYYCKRLIFTTIIEHANVIDYKYVADGTNLSDDDDYRPGLRALNELGVISPLAMAGLTKDMIRKACSLYHITIPFHNNSCLASRIPYGTSIREEILNMIRNGEKFLEVMGFYPVRLRYHDTIARIELSKTDLKRIVDDECLSNRIILRLKEIGFSYITLDIEGFRSGSMNIPLRNV